MLSRLSALYLTPGAHSSGGTLGAGLRTSGDCETVLAHALQCAAAARSAHPDDDELAVAALLHDVGWLLPRPQEGALLMAPPRTTGAAFLAQMGFPARVCALVAGDVQAERCPVATEPEHAARLSPGSTRAVTQQRGPVTPDAAPGDSASPDAQLCLALRRWCEAADVPGLALPGWEAHAPFVARVLASARWAAFDSPALPSCRRLHAVAPNVEESPLGAGGAGFVVVRGWLSHDELCALQAYAAAIPTLPPGEAFHTYEANGDGERVPSRTEHFAHLPHESGAGQHFLVAGRLRALCSALRGGRPMELYKEKLNYKLKGATGGYLPHVDLYHSINATTLVREFLLDDADVCVCMVAIDAMDEGNGCPYVAPGWHSRGAVAFAESAGVSELLTSAPLPVVHARDLPWQPVRLAAGDVLIYGNSMPHYSERNTSERNRRALFAVYSDARHGSQRGRYYAAEARGRRKDNSGAVQGKANGFFTGRSVHVTA